MMGVCQLKSCQLVNRVVAQRCAKMHTAADADTLGLASPPSPCAYVCVPLTCRSAALLVQRLHCRQMSRQAYRPMPMKMQCQVLR